MGRKVQHNNIVTDELLKQCNSENIELGKDFLDYLRSVDRSPNTIEAYAHDLNIFWVYLLQHCNNKFFIDLSKRDISKYQSYCLTEYKWSPARMRRVKSTLSSLSNYVENMLDDEYEGFRPIIRKIENPTNEKVFTKTVLSDEQVQGMLDYWVEKGKYDKACILALAVFSGRRKSELPRFKVSYFDDENIIYGSLYKTPEKIQTKGRGSRGKMLVVYTLAKPFKPYFDLWMNYRKEHGIESEWLFPKKVNGEYIDEPMDSSTLDSWADTFSKHLGEDFYFHSLRHFFTTSCSRSGLPDDVIQMLVGWNSLDMVAVYKDIDADEQFAKYFADGEIKQVRTKMSQLGYRKYRTFNNRYFQNIDTPLKAYFLGFIFADGWICANPEIRNYEFGIELQSGDRYILDKLNEELGNVHKIYHTEPEKAIICGKTVNRGHTDTLRVYSKPLVEDLIVNGISTNKTQKDIVPHVSDEFFFDFLRGYIDGDGCYWNTRQRPNDIYLHITCASKSVLEYLQNRLTSYNIKSQIYTEADKKHRLMCTNYNDMHFLINKMYKDENTFCLTRKLKLIEKYLDYREAS